MLPLDQQYPLLSVDELAVWFAALGALILGAKNCLQRRRLVEPRVPVGSNREEQAE